MRTLDLSLYALSALAELIGVLITIFDLSQTSRRLDEFKSKEPPINLAAAATSRSTITAAGRGRSATSPEQRLDALEEWKHKELPGELDRLDAELRQLINAVAENTYKTFMARWRLVRDYLRGGQQSWYRRYRGPIVVGVGIVLGLGGNVVNIYWLSSS